MPEPFDISSPWTTLDSQLRYQNPWIEVREDHVLRPDGQPGIYGVVTFKNWAIGVVPLTAEGDTYLVGQYRYPLEEYSWEIPEGGGPKFDSVRASARRELQEETGLTAHRWTYLGRVHTSNSVCNETGFLYLAQDLVQGASHPEGTEQLTLRKIPLARAVQMALEGEITDALAVVGLLRAQAYLASAGTLAPIDAEPGQPGLPPSI